MPNHGTTQSAKVYGLGISRQVTALVPKEQKVGNTGGC